MVIEENEHIKTILLELADLLEFLGENQFKVIAYRRAARTIETFDKPISELIRNGEYETLPGIGKIILQKTEEILRTGNLRKLEEICSQIPGSIREMIKFLPISPKKIACLVKNGIDSLDKLKNSLADGSLEKIPDLGEQSRRKIKAYFSI